MLEVLVKKLVNYNRETPNTSKCSQERDHTLKDLTLKQTNKQNNVFRNSASSGLGEYFEVYEVSLLSSIC